MLPYTAKLVIERRRYQCRSSRKSHHRRFVPNTNAILAPILAIIEHPESSSLGIFFPRFDSCGRPQGKPQAARRYKMYTLRCLSVLAAVCGLQSHPFGHVLSALKEQ